jgi:hypothetical protein
MSTTSVLSAPPGASARATNGLDVSDHKKKTGASPLATPRHGKEVRFGDLILRFTSEFSLRWSDKGSGADDDVAFYHPIPPVGFVALGSIGIGTAASHFNPNGNVAALCVKAAGVVAGKAPLAAPLGYDFIWNDSGSGADMDGSCWRPVPPDGYVALGDVFVTDHGAPSLSDVMCVATELVGEGVVGARIWTDNGSGADRDFGAWQVEVTQAYRDTQDGLFAVNSFVGRDSHDKPASSPVAWTLRLPIPTIVGGDAAKPTLDSRTRPADKTTPVIDRIVTLPFTAVVDGDKTFQWKMENSPFYDLERSVYYDLLIFEDNRTGRDQTKTQSVTTGVTKEASETFSITTGLKVTYESGVEAGGFSSKVSVELSIELGYSTTTSVSVFKSEQDDAELIIPGQHAAALWIEANSIRLIRSDNTPVGPSLAFGAGNSAYLSSQYPAPVDGQASLVKHRRHPTRLARSRG